MATYWPATCWPATGWAATLPAALSPAIRSGDILRGVMSQHRIGIDLGGTKIEIVALAPDGSESLRHRVDTPAGYPATLQAIAALVRDCEAKLGVTASVGIGIPG